MSNLMSQRHCLGKPFDSALWRTIPPEPGLSYVRQTDRIGQQDANLIGIRRIEPAKLASHGRIQSRPYAH